MFVALHELTHVLTTSIGHKDEFWANFKYVLQHAKSAGIYEPIDYKKEPQQYCGMTITDNPFYDM
jgi:predicted metal-dependent hydrolase